MNLDFSKNKDGLVPAIIQDNTTHKVLMLGYLNKESLSLTLNTNVVVNSPMILPELQNSYGQGSNGAAYTDITNDWGTSNWGAPLDGTSRMYFTGSTRAYDAQPNNMKDFFQSAVSAITSVSIQKGFEDGSVRFSYSNNDTQDLTPNSHLESHSFNLRGT